MTVEKSQLQRNHENILTKVVLVKKFEAVLRVLVVHIRWHDV